MSTDAPGAGGSGLARRFQILTAVVVVISSTAIGAVSYVTALDGLHQSFRTHGVALVDITSRNAEYALFTLDEEALSALTLAVETDPVVNYATVHDATGKVVFEKAATAGPDTLPQFDPGNPEREIQVGSKKWFEIVAPVYTGLGPDPFTGPEGTEKQLLGYIRFGLGFDALQQHARRQLIVTAGVMTTMLLLSGLLIVLLSRAITRPLSELAQGARGVARGQMRPLTVSAGIAEIDELTLAFNKMLRELAEKTDSESRYRTKLEELVEDRTQALRAALRRAESANVAKSRFLANISHEIRTPLNAVLGLSELLNRGVDVEHSQDFAQTIHESAIGLLALINDVLDFSKGAAGEIHIASRTVDLRGLVHEVVRMVRGAAESKGLSLTWNAEPDVPQFVLSDRLRLRQIMINLISNAVKFTEQGEVHVGVKVLDDEPAGEPLMELFVRDTGPGIPPSKHARLFNPFVQANDSMTRSTGGTGLGLAITKQIVEAMGGEILLQSELGAGSIFKVQVRLSVDDTPELLKSDLDRDWQPDSTDSPLLVLVVDDHLTNRQVARQLLRAMGHQTVEADSALAALSLLSERRFDVVLMDCQMPSMDGYTATRKIREGAAGEANRSILIAAVTAHALPEDRDRCLKAGMNEYLAKPITMRALARVMKNMTQEGDRASEHESALPADSSAMEESALAHIRTMGGGTGSAYAEILTSFADALRSDVAEIHQALESRNASEVQALAHRLKSSSLQIGATDFGLAMDDIERLASEGDLDSVQHAWVDLEPVVGRLLSWVHGELAAESKRDAVESTEPPKPLELPTPTAEDGSAQQKPTSILVVEDDPLICRIIRRTLREYDLTVIMSGSEAVNHCLDGRPDLVLCDMMLPKMSGMDVYSAVVDADPELGPRFVFMTGGVYEPATRKFLDKTQNRVLSKPFNIAKLRSLVRDATAGQLQNDSSTLS